MRPDSPAYEGFAHLTSICQCAPTVRNFRQTASGGAGFCPSSEDRASKHICLIPVWDVRLPDLRIIEVRDLPGLKIQTLGTHILYLSDLSHPPCLGLGSSAGKGMASTKLSSDVHFGAMVDSPYL